MTRHTNDEKVINYPEIMIEWDFDSDLDPEAADFYNSLNKILEPRGQHAAGCVWVETSEEESVTSVMILVDDELMHRTGSSIARIALYGEDLHPEITIDSEYYLALQDGTMNLSSIYHELGHYYSGHMVSDNGIDDHDIMYAGRIAGEEKWVNQEVEADLFAAHYVSPLDILDAFTERENYIFKQQLLGLVDKEISKAQLREYSKRYAMVEFYMDSLAS